MRAQGGARKKIAVIGAGISGLAAAWLLNERHDVTIYEQNDRLGGHSHTVEAAHQDYTIPVDTGFIVYNEATYPNLTALFAHLGVETRRSEMSFAVSLDNGDLEYCGHNLAGLFAQPRNLFRSRFWSMLHDLQRFYREAPRDVTLLDEMHISLGDYLDSRTYGAAFRDDHLLPMAGAIWSAPAKALLAYPAASFIRFQHNHGLLKFIRRPDWRTVVGGSRTYVEALTRRFRDNVRFGCAATGVVRDDAAVTVRDARGGVAMFDDVVIATHADQALALLDKPTPPEQVALGAFRYSRNHAILHSDAALMPKRRSVWSSWNYIGRRADGDKGVTVTYWMNRLQGIAADCPLYVTLNPARQPRDETVMHAQVYDHPLFDDAAVRAQRALWGLQGVHGTWFCGSYFGAGFHEDGLQAGLAVAEALGGVRRPWSVPNESGRIVVGPSPRPRQRELAA